MSLAKLGISSKKNNQIEINLVPILDMLIVLIFFLILTGVFTSYSKLETPAPIVDVYNEIDELEQEKLNLVAYVYEDKVQLVGGGGKIIRKTIPNIGPNALNTDEIHKIAVMIKKKFPKENVIILKPMGSVKYDTIVQLMQITKELKEHEIGEIAENAGLELKEARKLFPNAVLGNIPQDDSEDAAELGLGKRN